MDLDLRLLSAFVAVAEDLNFTRAARRLHVAQPALSRQIRQLERQLDLTLFERTTRRVELTAAGQELLAPARRALSGLDVGIDAARLAQRGEFGHLRLGFTLSGNFDVAPPLLRAFREEHPNVEVDVSRAATAVHVERLKTHTLDVAFVRPPLHDAEGIECVTLLTEPMVVALRADHPLARRRSIRRSDLRDERFVLFPRAGGPGLFDTIVGYLWPGEDPLPHVSDERPDEETMVEAAAAGTGLAVVFRSRTRYLRHPNVVYRRLSPPLLADLGLAWRSDETSRLVTAFVAHCRTRIPT